MTRRRHDWASRSREDGTAALRRRERWRFPLPRTRPGLVPIVSIACVTGASSGRIGGVIASFLSEIPFPVWFAIGCVVVFLLNHYVKQAAARAKGAVPAPRDVRKAGKEKDWNRLNEHHTPKIHGKREDMATAPRARLLAPSMVYALCNGDPVNKLTLSAPEATKNMLERDWGITDRESLIRQLYSLLRAGHREDFAALRERCQKKSWAESEIARLSKTADSSMEDWESRWRIRRFLANDRGIQDLDFAAWDFFRAANLTRAGAGQGWLSEDEAWEAFRTTRWLWAAEGDAQTAANDLHDRNRGEFLVGKNGLWTAIPWDAPYPTPRFLLLDALADMGALRLLQPSSWHAASAWEKDLDSQTRSRAPLSIGGKPIVN